MENSVSLAFSWLFGILWYGSIWIGPFEDQWRLIQTHLIHSAALIYYVLCTYVSPPFDSFSEVAVYPPKTIEEEEERLRSLGRKGSEAELDTPSVEKDEAELMA